MPGWRIVEEGQGARGFRWLLHNHVVHGAYNNRKVEEKNGQQQREKCSTGKFLFLFFLILTAVYSLP